MLNVILQWWSAIVAEPGLVLVVLVALIAVSTTVAGIWLVVVDPLLGQLRLAWRQWRQRRADRRVVRERLQRIRLEQAAQNGDPTIPRPWPPPHGPKGFQQPGGDDRAATHRSRSCPRTCRARPGADRAPLPATSTDRDHAGSDGVAFIEAERKRQVEDEGWTPEHDDTHTDGILAGAASLLAIEQTDGDFLWPNYEHSWLKGLHDKHELTPRIRQLAIAGALIAAEIDRLQRVKS